MSVGAGRSRWWRRSLGGGLVLVVAYVGTAWIGSSLGSIGSLTVWYPPAGLALAGAVVVGWPAIPFLAAGELITGVVVFHVDSDFTTTQLVVNAVGGSVFAENIRALAFEGRLATVGYVDNVLQADLDLEALHGRRLTLFGVSNKQRTKAQRAASIPRFVSEVMPHFASGRIRPQIDQVFDFKQLPAAKARMEAGEHVGKIVLRMPDGVS